LLGLMIEVCFKLLSLQRNNQGDVSWIIVICFVTEHLPRLHQLYSVVMTLHHDSRHASQAFVAPQWSWELGTWICIKWGIAQSGKEAISNIYICTYIIIIYIYYYYSYNYYNSYHKKKIKDNFVAEKRKFGLNLKLLQR
jgi:hypothetical protein